MAGDTLITVVGNLTADPELRFTPGGHAVCNFTVASTPRSFDKGSNEWKDGETLFLPCGVWREAAENTHESLRKGMRVIVSGRLKARTFETKDGDKRTVMELDVEEVGPSLRYAQAKVTRAARQQGASTSAAAAPGANDWGARPGESVAPATSADPWAVPETDPAF